MTDTQKIPCVDSLDECEYHHTTFSKVNGVKGHFEAKEFDSCTFENCDFSSADFSGARFGASVFSR